MHEILAHPIAAGAVAGIIAAATIDFQAFRTMKSFDDLVKYSWSIAIFRWCQGAVVGAVAAAGHGVVT